MPKSQGQQAQRQAQATEIQGPLEQDLRNESFDIQDT